MLVLKDFLVYICPLIFQILMARNVNNTFFGDVILTNRNLETYRKLASPFSGFKIEAKFSLRLPEISAGLQVAMSEDAFLKLPDNFPLSPTHSSDT